LNRDFVCLDSDDLSHKLLVTYFTLELGEQLLERMVWKKLPTNSYIAQPIIFSAIMTGPEMEKMEPFCFSSPSPRDFEFAILTVLEVECR
jgi:hypothetical protein